MLRTAQESVKHPSQSTLMTDEPFGLHRIGQIRIQVTDVDRAVAFYRDALGMAFLYAFPGMAFFDVARR